MKKVQRGEGAEQSGLQEKDEREVKRGAVFHPPRCEHGHGRDHRREQHHQQPEPVHGHVVLNVERRYPLMTLLELKRARSRIEGFPHHQGQGEREEAEGKGESARKGCLVSAQAGDQHRPDERHEREGGDEGKSVHGARQPQIKNSTSAASATPMTRR
jgi:hypothetical protein